MPKPATPAAEIRTLKTENIRLQKRIERLEAEVARLKAHRERASRHAANSTGKEAEDYVCRLLGAKATERNADHDFVIGRRRFEIKGSKCNLFYNDAAQTYAYCRWTWHNFLGVGSKKTYHRLILVAEADPSRKDTYQDKRSPYVIFDLPFAFAKKIAAERAQADGRFAFHLISHRDGARSSALCQEMWKFEITRAELKQRYLG
jgi:hypothetical protein